jgi:hypothetical protein
LFKRLFFWGISAGALATVACIIYDRIYFFATEADFSRIINIGSLAAICLLSCLVAACVYGVLTTWLPNKGEIVFNFALTIFSFGSIIIPIAMPLPLDIPMPELFPALAVPMHFFPAIAWYTLRPLFIEV